LPIPPDAEQGRKAAGLKQPTNTVQKMMSPGSLALHAQHTRNDCFRRNVRLAVGQKVQESSGYLAHKCPDGATFKQQLPRGL